MTPKYSVSPAHLSIGAGLSLGDVSVKYAIFGGSSSVVMTPEALQIHFPHIFPQEQEVVSDVLRRIHDGFPKSFPDVGYSRVEASTQEHSEILPPGNASEYLQRFQVPSLGLPFAKFGEYAEEHSARFEIRGKEQLWACRWGVEKSQLIPTGLFVDWFISIGDVTPSTPFNELGDRLRMLAAACLEAIGLKYEQTG